jgi:hypothetical protein
MILPYSTMLFMGECLQSKSKDWEVFNSKIWVENLKRELDGKRRRK